MIVRDDYRVPTQFGDPTFDGLGSFLKKAAKTVVKTVAAPFVVPTAAVVKAATWTVAKTGLPSAAKVDNAVASQWNSNVGKDLRSNYSTQVKIGAAAGLAIISGGSAVSAITAGTSAGIKAVAAEKEAATGVALIPTTDTAPSATSTQVPGGTAAKAAPFALALGGLAVAGPVGALVGGIIGFALGRKTP